MAPKRRAPTVRDLRNAIGKLQFGRDIIGLDIEFEPSVGIIAGKIDKLGAEFESFRDPLTRSIKLVLMPSIRRNFDEGGRPEPWEPLAEYTIKRRGYDAWPILVRTGKLRKVASSFQIWSVGKNGAIIERLPNSVSYGYIHQAGYGGMGALISLARRRLGKDASDWDVNGLAMEMLDATLLNIEGDRRRARVGKGADIPQRRFIIMQDEDVEKITQIFSNWLGEKVEEAEGRGVYA